MQDNPKHTGCKRATLNLWPDVAKILGVGRNAVYAAAARGDIPILRIGGRRLVSRAALERMLDDTTITTGRPAAAQVEAAR